ncbi:hypothetical protein [Vogesella sp. LIG4]|uniref:hypothetical protein n=1 Tax=Vogesella sp. LIG4 TaxID=1192162 RepID=UPI00081FABA9|nr:hypothetical protein [Vogesella sp. LIG4]SCK11385.1 hypothetical protein PSELUDRAFT_0951 [Vogesella sp. LIG4]
MLTRSKLLIATVAVFSALSAGARAQGTTDAAPQSMREEMKMFHDAVMSGALTDAELQTLKQDQATFRQRMQDMRAKGELSATDRAELKKMHEEMHAKLMALINNSDRTQPRDKWPSQILPEPGHHGMPGKGGERDGMEWGSMGDAHAFHDAVRSGALTDSEIATLRQQQKALHDKLMELINNNDRTQPRQAPAAAPQP